MASPTRSGAHPRRRPSRAVVGGSPHGAGRTASARDRVLCAACDLMRDQGYPHVSVDAILAASGVSRSNFYYHFPSKDDLVLAVVDAWHEELAASVVDPILGDPALTPLGRVRGILDALLERLQENHCRAGCPFGSLANAEAEHNDLFRAKLVVVFDGFLAMFEGLFTEAAAAGELRPGAPAPARLAAATLTVVQGGLLLSKTYGDAALMRRSADALLDLCARC